MDDFAVGWLQGMYALPAVALALVGGAALDRWDTRMTGIVSALLMTAGNLVFNLGGHYTILMAGRLLVGVGCIMFNLVAGKMLTLWFRERQRGIAMSILNTAWPIAAIISFSTLVAAGSALGWQPTTLIINGYVALSALVFIFVAPRDPEGEEVASGPPGKPDVRPADTNPPPAQSLRIFGLPSDIWLTATAWFFFTLSMASFFTFGAGFLSSRGYGYGEGSFMVGLIMWAAIPGSLLAGWLIDRYGKIKTYMLVPGIGAALCLLALQPLVYPEVIILVAGFLAGVVPVAVYSLPGQVVSPARLGLAFGVILTFSNLGNVVGPVTVGWINTATDAYEPGMLFIAIAFAAVAVFAALLGRHSLVKRGC
jgi:predicted MFS family arabinose efflux permease